MSENVYGMAPYPTARKKSKKTMLKGSEEIVSMLHIKRCPCIKALLVRY